MTDTVTIHEMAPRDGLQNEAAQIATNDKVRLVDMLSDSGLRHIEVTSFVSPKWVPQLADAAEVMDTITRNPRVTYAALTPNMRGLTGALEARADAVAVFASASEGFSQQNINCSISESLARFAPVIETATQAGMPVRGYVSCVTDCPFDGPTAPASVARVTAALIDLGCFEVSLGDTIGAGTPARVAAMLDAVLKVADAPHLAGHFHDTHGHALGNIEVSLDKGLRVFDASAGGLGGCPYAPGAAGNVATERVVELVETRGFATGINREKLAAAAAFAQSLRS